MKTETPEQLINRIDKLLEAMRNGDEIPMREKEEPDEDSEVVDTVCIGGKFYELRRKKQSDGSSD